ncbi:hypothetical protein BKA70DRAFT_1271550 [Coprinopsis sp. MPI-PUGE-AT-0042]|nr:hypothetical protein BKA70DRAFT_1271550 [Coprinopsis sp. MPI-PUGE-AT-0042]
MPPRPRPASRNALHPPNDAATYRDLLMFEERLKTTALSLQKRKSRYQFFLFWQLLVVAFLLWEVLLPPQVSILVIPWGFLVHLVYPQTQAQVHPYVSTGLLFVNVTTLLLFFASGMYSEKIAYANKYVPHANRALRSFNMVLNVRKPPLRSQFAWNPINFFFPRPPEQSPTSPTARPPSPSGSRARSSSTTRPMASLPPASNPRGELVFSSRVDKSFREGYERYRSTFERKRDERLREERRKTWWGSIIYRARETSPAPAAALTPSAATTPAPSRTASATGSRPAGSRSVTPEPSTGIMMKSRAESRPATPTPPSTPGLRRRGTDMRTLALERSLEHSRTEQ